MKLRLIACLLIATMALTACTVSISGGENVTLGQGERVTGSGRAVTQNHAVSDFTALDVSNAFTIEIMQGNTFSVSTTTDDNITQYVKVEKSGALLRIGLEQNKRYRNVTLKARVTMPKLAEVHLSGATKAEIAGFKSGDSLWLDLSGASQLDAAVETGDLKATASGASRITVRGTGNNLIVSVSGASNADLDDFAAASADVSADGASTARVNVSGKLDASASGASTIRYRGNPILGRNNASGASSIRPR